MLWKVPRKKNEQVCTIQIPNQTLASYLSASHYSKITWYSIRRSLSQTSSFFRSPLYVFVWSAKNLTAVGIWITHKFGIHILSKVLLIQAYIMVQYFRAEYIELNISRRLNKKLANPGIWVVHRGSKYQSCELFDYHCKVYTAKIYNYTHLSNVTEKCKCFKTFWYLGWKLEI